MRETRPRPRRSQSLTPIIWSTPGGYPQVSAALGDNRMPTLQGNYQVPAHRKGGPRRFSRSAIPHTGGINPAAPDREQLVGDIGREVVQQYAENG